MKLCLIVVFLVASVQSLQPQKSNVSRFKALTTCTPLDPSPSSRRQIFSSLLVSVATSQLAVTQAWATDRLDLLAAITNNASDAVVMDIITGLKDPSAGKAIQERLDGQWELIWSYKAEAFSPLLKLPPPFRPTSYQYFGAASAVEVGEGRIAQGLTGGILGNQQLWLSSGALPYPSDPSILEIQPPFRLELGGKYGTGVRKRVIVEAGSDADFRQVNGRTEEEQAAGKNQYQQLYLEDNGPGSLRVSSVIAGDPVIVGDIFVHRKM